MGVMFWGYWGLYVGVKWGLCVGVKWGYMLGLCDLVNGISCVLGLSGCYMLWLSGGVCRD